MEDENEAIMSRQIAGGPRFKFQLMLGVCIEKQGDLQIASGAQHLHRTASPSWLTAKSMLASPSVRLRTVIRPADAGRQG